MFQESLRNYEMSICRIHPKRFIDRICISNSCLHQENLMCIECSEDHTGCPMQIENVIKDLLQQSLKHLDQKSSDIKYKEKLLQEVNDYFNKTKNTMVQQIGQCKDRLILFIQYHTEEYLNDLKEFSQLSYEKLNEDQALQEQIIQLSIQNNLKLPDLQCILKSSEKLFTSQCEQILTQIQTLYFQPVSAFNLQEQKFTDLVFEWENRQISAQTNTHYQMLQLNNREIIVSDDQGLINIVDVQNGNIIQRFEPDNLNNPKDCMFIINEQIFGTRTSNGHIIIFDRTIGKEILKYDLMEENPEEYNNSCLYNQSHQKIVCSIKRGENDFGLILFTLCQKKVYGDDDSEQSIRYQLFENNQNFEGNHQKNGDDIVLSISQDNTLRQWNLQTMISTEILKENDGILCVRHLDENRIVYNLWSGIIVTYDLVQRQKLRSYKTVTNQSIQRRGIFFYVLDVLSSNRVILYKDQRVPSIEILNLDTSEITTLGKEKELEGVVKTMFLETIPPQVIVFSLFHLQKFKIL